MKSFTLPFLLGLTSLANLATARTDLEGCVSSEIVIDYYASYLWYVPDTGEICSFLDCGGGRAPPKTDKPGCGGYKGTATVTPDYIEGWGPNGKQAASTTTIAATTSATVTAATTSTASQAEVSDSSSGSMTASASGSQTPSITAAPSSSSAASMTTTASPSSAANSTSAAASSTPTGNAAAMPASNLLGVVALMGAMVGAMAL